MAYTFQAKEAYTLLELNEKIKASAQEENIDFPTPDQLVTDYQNIQKEYHRILPTKHHNSNSNKNKPNTISSWSESDIQAWAQEEKITHQSSQAKTIAVIQRAVQLNKGYSPRTIQLLSLLCLINKREDKGRLLQINTGEGKSLMVAMLAIFLTLQGQKVDVATTSTDLSKREVYAQKSLFNCFHMTVGENSIEGIEAKAAVYKRDIVYGTPHTLQADILDTEFFEQAIRQDRPFEYAIVDEVDSMLLDNYYHTTRIADTTPSMAHLGIAFATIWQCLQHLDERILTSEGKFFFPEVAQNPQATDSKETSNTITFTPIANRKKFLQEKMCTRLKPLFRLVSDEERKAFEEFQELKNAHQQLYAAAAQDDEQKSSDEECQENMDKLRLAQERIESCTWSQKGYQAFLPIPSFLCAYAHAQFPLWITKCHHR